MSLARLGRRRSAVDPLRLNRTSIPRWHGPAVLTDGIHVPGVGQLVDVGPCWGLRYDHCEHTQLIARPGLEDVQEAVRHIARRFAVCLSCRLEHAVNDVQRHG
jgi:hypothetical protein